MTQKTLAVIRATGAQGGGLVRAVLGDANSGFRVRAVTRQPASDKARALAALGAEVVAGDADDPSTLDAAFAGAYGAFCVTNFWEHGDPARELRQAEALARGAPRAGGPVHARSSGGRIVGGVAIAVTSRVRRPLDREDLPLLYLISTQFSC